MVTRALSALALLATLLAGCNAEPRLQQPVTLQSPYPSTAEPLWAVAPLRNDSGASIADILRISDAVAAKVAEVRGLSVLPVNRTLAAMRALRLPAIDSPEDARRVAAVLGVDGLIVGSITAYDPYNPPKLGLTLALYGGEGTSTAPDIDPGVLTAAASESLPAASRTRAQPALATASVYLDAANHDVLARVQEYSQGRHDPRTALGWRGVLANMDLYTEFVAFDAVHALLRRESRRLAGAALPPGADPQAGAASAYGSRTQSLSRGTE